MEPSPVPPIRTHSITFQYPQRIVNQWNWRRCVHQHNSAALSVSSTDRQPMEPGAHDGNAAVRTVLSVSSTDRQPMEHTNSARRCITKRSFSILNGSSTNGTSQTQSRRSRARRFQYPQRIVNQWNSRARKRTRAAANLSVSSTDRQPMEPALRRAGVCACLSFSILNGSSTNGTDRDLLPSPL